METTQLVFTFEGSPGPSQIAAKLRFQAGLLEGMDATTAASRKNTDEEADEAPPVRRSAAKRAAAVEDSFEDEAQTEEVAEDFEDEEEEKPVRVMKTKAPTMKDVDEACRAHAKRNSFEETKALLLKKFKTMSVKKLRPEQYPQVIAAMKG